MRQCVLVCVHVNTSVCARVNHIVGALQTACRALPCPWVSPLVVEVGWYDERILSVCLFDTFVIYVPTSSSSICLYVCVSVWACVRVKLLFWGFCLRWKMSFCICLVLDFSSSGSICDQPRGWKNCILKWNVAVFKQILTIYVSLFVFSGKLS